MARIGLKNFKYSELDENENTVSPKSLGKAIDCKVSVETNSAELFADDALAESDYTFSKATVTITVDDDDDSILAPLLGHTITEEYFVTTDATKQNNKKYYTKTNNNYTEFTGENFTEGTDYYEKNVNGGEVIRKDTDIAPYIAFGRIITKLKSGVYSYKVEFLSKVKFKEAMPDEKTKNSSIEFGTTSIEGTAMKKLNGEWSKTKTFASYQEASEYLDSLLTAKA